MRFNKNIGLQNVQAVYSGAEGELWELLMGEQIHIGGFQSSMDLATRAGIRPGMAGVDLCCCTGAGMRFLVKFCGAATMRGVDATSKVIERGRERCRLQGLNQAISFVPGDACSSGLPSASADFIWGEDAWCYVVDKPILISEAARIVKPGGVIAFTDWLEGPTALTNEEANRFLAFMKFPSLAGLHDYKTLLADSGCAVEVACDTGRFADAVRLYLEMIEKQLMYDALRTIEFNTELAEWLLAEMRFTQSLAQQGKLIQGLIVARKEPVR